MRVGLDLDGVFYVFEDAVRSHLVTTRGMHPDLLPPVKEFKFFPEWGMPEDSFYGVCEEALAAGTLFAVGDPYPGSVDSLSRLIDAGHTLHVVTARGFGPPGVAEAATRQWCATYLPPITSLTFASDKTIVNVDVMIEDKLSNYDALIAAGVRATLINRPWNRQDTPEPWRRRVDTVAEFVDDVLSLQAAHV